MAIEEYLPQIEIHMYYVIKLQKKETSGQLYPSKLEGKQILLKSLLRSLFMLKKQFFLYLIIKMAFGNILLCHMSTFFCTFAFYG